MGLAIEVVAIGNEILTGFTINTNAAVIGQALLGIGFKVNSQRTLPDNNAILKAGLQNSLDNFDLIICTGGLGPTCDDQTRQTIAELFDCELKFEPKIAEYLHEKYPNRPVSIDDQAMIPSKAKYILNEIGTASALLFESKEKFMVFLPGIPAELQHFMHTQIIPLLKQRYHNQIDEFHQQCNFIQLSETQVDPILRHLSSEYPPVEFGIYPDLGLISVHIISHLPTIEENLTFQQPIKEHLISAFKDSFYSDTSRSIEETICALCHKNNITLTVAQTSPYLNLSAKLAPVLSDEANIKVILTGIPKMLVAEQIYTAEITIAFQKHGTYLAAKTFTIRGNKAMIIKRAEHLALGELFRVLQA